MQPCTLERHRQIAGVVPRQAPFPFPPVKEDTGNDVHLHPSPPQAQDQAVVLRPVALPVADDAGYGLRPHHESRVRQRALDEDVSCQGGGGPVAVKPCFIATSTIADGVPRKVSDVRAAE